MSGVLAGRVPVIGTLPLVTSSISMGSASPHGSVSDVLILTLWTPSSVCLGSIIVVSQLRATTPCLATMDEMPQRTPTFSWQLEPRRTSTQASQHSSRKFTVCIAKTHSFQRLESKERHNKNPTDAPQQVKEGNPAHNSAMTWKCQLTTNKKCQSTCIRLVQVSANINGHAFFNSSMGLNHS